MTAKFFVRKSVAVLKTARVGRVGDGIDNARLACFRTNTGIHYSIIGKGVRDTEPWLRIL